MSRRALRFVGPVALVIFLPAPVAWITTYLMSPFWGWFEAKTGIESLGHSGPADWCFYVTYIVFVLALGVIVFRRPPSANTPVPGV